MILPSSLYYPHFTPSTEHLRSLLLFYNDLNLIVPSSDQWHVSQRDHLAEINEFSKCENGSPTIKLIAPEPYANQWFRNPDDKKAFSLLVKRNAKRVKRENLFEKLSFKNSQFGYPIVENEQNHRDLFIHLSKHAQKRWRYISAQKMPVELITDLTGRGVAIPQYCARHPEYNQTLEEQPVLMVAELVDFIIARLARDISQDNGLLSVTFSENSYLDHTFQPKQSISKRTSLFLSFAIPASIPLGIQDLDIHDYIDVREEFSPFRKNLAKVARDLVENSFLDEEQSQNIFVGRLAQSIAELEQQIDDTEKKLKRSRVIRPTQFMLEMASTAAGIGIGAVLGDITGALVGGAIGKSINGITNNFSSSNEVEDAQFVQNTAMMKAAVGRRLANPIRKIPNYWV